MLALRVEITRLVDADQPGWVECRLVDASGATHLFVEKLPVVSDAALEGPYPRPGVVACVVLERRRDDEGELWIVDTAEPWGVASTAGVHRFAVRPHALVDDG